VIQDYYLKDTNKTTFSGIKLDFILNTVVVKVVCYSS